MTDLPVRCGASERVARVIPNAFIYEPWPSLDLDPFALAMLRLSSDELRVHLVRLETA